mmetsp:Transcript_5337/g.8049  ORF Transcript_5337/g.8049 Transcript_5337/m.8049 type:complete len:86 (+) Transcript_5337:277-534(+)
MDMVIMLQEKWIDGEGAAEGEEAIGMIIETDTIIRAGVQALLDGDLNDIVRSHKIPGTEVGKRIESLVIIKGMPILAATVQKNIK